MPGRYSSGLLLLFALLLGGCRAELLGAINERQANEAVALLYKYSITANKLKGDKQSFRVTVEQADFSAAVDLLNAHGLPSTPDIEISQMFPADALVSTPTAERARLLSAIEQRLEQSLMRIDQVISARVHASYELQSSERRKVVQPMRLSVLLTYEGEVEEGLFIEKVKRFIKNSFHELRYEDIGVALFKQSEPMMPARLPSTSISLNSGLMGIVAVLMILLIGAWGLLRSGRGQGATIGAWKNTRLLKWLASQRKS